MALVDYSDSEDEENRQEDVTPPPSKRRKTSSATDDGREATKAVAAPSMPPLPAAFMNMYSSKIKQSARDDPTMHQGRKRTMPHVDGNWPTHVFLEWHPNPGQTAALTAVINREIHTRDPKATGGSAIAPSSASQTTTPAAPNANASMDPTVHSFLQDSLGVPQPLHISLSRSLSLPTSSRDPFTNALSSAVSKSGIKPFNVVGRKLAWFPNEDCSRWFFVLNVRVEDESDSGNELRKLGEVCNVVCEEFGFEGLGTRWHVSLAWRLGADRETKVAKGEKAEQDDAVVATIFGGFGGGEGGEVDAAEAGGEELMGLKFKVEEVKIRIGQDMHCISLGKKKVFDEKRLFG